MTDPQYEFIETMQNIRVLVVEDFELLRESLAQGLREAGFIVDTASDGEEGLHCIESSEHDVVVLDVMLPKLDGLCLLKKIRETNRRTSVLLLTAKDATEDRVRGLDAGADDYVIKPFVVAELLARIRALVRRRFDSTPSVIRIADLEIDTTARRVSRSGKNINLSAREYALLEFMAKRIGQVVTRTEIWNHVYDFNSSAESNVVDVFIGHLRRKIEVEGLQRLIHTRRGQGYMLGVSE